MIMMDMIMLLAMKQVMPLLTDVPDSVSGLSARSRVEALVQEPLLPVWESLK